MDSEAPSWADQWGPGGIGVMEEDKDANKKGNSNSKARGKGGLNRVKGAAIRGAQKIRSGASNSVKWVKSICWKKGSPK